ncbi:MAG: hypothetical protein MUO82_02555 [Candidatus Thermoplasmatota archaeon]|nr:hypothetical protein [Candidatus Thermoplasmatota archaeon]
MHKIKKGFDMDKLRRLLRELAETNKKANSITKKLENEILKLKRDYLMKSTLIQFSKWCNTSPPYSGESKIGGQQVARKISMLIFGKIIARLD